MTKQRGFTLMELIITIAVLGILGAIAALSSQSMLENYRVNGAARQVYSDMQMARLRAIKEGKEFAIEFVNNTTYCVKQKATGAVNWDDGCMEGAGGDTVDDVVKTVNLANDYSGVSAGINTGRVEFNPNGTAGATAGANPLTLSRGAKTKSLNINTSTGNIRVS